MDLNNENELDSSDSSDEDFVPEGAEGSGSELGSEDEVESGDEVVSSGPKRKGGRPGKAPKRKKMDEDQTKDTEETGQTEEETKKRTDALWADFLKDTSSKPVKKPEVVPQAKPAVEPTTVQSTKPSPSDVLTSKIFGDLDTSSSTRNLPKIEPVQSEPALPSTRPGPPGGGGGGGGMSKILGILGKTKKKNIIESSKQDWESFKSAEGISEELAVHNRGKKGYLERQDFLERTDLRQFEVEKALRDTQRRSRLK